ncbi:MAG: hydroxymethylbilane synthase [Rhodospirillales bacterium]|nr:hydroxymethylbilane synthase [Rhodospirillales bacterium]
MKQKHIRIGTRGSPLAIVQANQVRKQLVQANPELQMPELITIKTTGDQITNRLLADIGGKGLFTKEIEQALMDDEIDIAVHSMKDVETKIPGDLVVDCFLKREDPRDALLGAKSVNRLPKGARIGTSSIRRSAQLLSIRPDVQISLLRGNIDTRLKKLDAGKIDAMILAIAGLKRIGQEDRIDAPLQPTEFLPAVSQGVVGIQRRLSDINTANFLAPINHVPTSICVAAERSMLEALDGSCRTPIGGLAIIERDNINLSGMLVWPDGSGLKSFAYVGKIHEPVLLGQIVGDELRKLAGPKFFEELM